MRLEGLGDYNPGGPPKTQAARYCHCGKVGHYQGQRKRDVFCRDHRDDAVAQARASAAAIDASEADAARTAREFSSRSPAEWRKSICTNGRAEP